MAVIFAAILPQFRTMYRSWDTQKRRSQIVQNARVLQDCFNRNFASAIRITSVSGPEEMLGYIEFEKNNGDTYRMEVSGENYIRYGPAGNLSDFAGLVSQLQFQCYGLEDMTTMTTEPDEIRLVKVSTVIYNPEDPSRSQAYSNQVFIETNSATEAHLLAWYKFDEAAGLEAADSSVYRRDGQLNNMTGAEWSEGYIGGALGFDGADDYVSFDMEWEGESATLTAWVKMGPTTDWAEVININDVIGIRLDNPDGNLAFWSFVYVGDNSWESLNINQPHFDSASWHHIVYVVNSETLEHQLYVDGDLEKTGAMSGPLDFEERPSFNSRIGQHSIIGKYDYPFNGLIDDVRIYDIALTEEEVQEISPLGPLRYWALDETGNTMIDSAGNMNGSCRGNVQRGELSFRDRFLNCIYLNGKNSYVELPSNGQLNGLDIFSASAWIRPEDTGQAAWVIGRNDNSCGWSFGISGTSVVLEVWDRQFLAVPDVLTMEEWSHVAVSYDPVIEGATSFYVNGECVGQFASDKRPFSGTLSENWAIGTCDRDGNFKGHIDEVKIFYYGLTEAQVKIIAGLNTSTDPYLDSEIRP
jgi:hypothetical protein